MAFRDALARLLGMKGHSRASGPGLHQKSLLTCALAEVIVNDYGRALEIGEKFPLGAPESLLSRSRKEIADAIVHYTRCLHKAGTLDPRTYEVLCIGYSELAHFIPDPEAQEGLTAWAAFSSGDPTRISSSTSSAMERHQQIVDEKTRRQAEFKNIMIREGISAN